ncbi:uncharacterized protein BO97DRAFT_231854 [Aspergillus homomorphus CBS 101889]|uniref:Condensation domain-containing protein n=1 Tax=Aspergillus homomorphus (strain CBS 101889) TaxID=1450537 RepID=A0A395HLW3_ASPHC|nr:hypothetical protein BO97DRAFT_231854 [Aspergillus homomorphus CBS 101889]RAL07858.1 hypothetical protein BO97DRAFT_231854 [Aspergillus homomorphus CBS 101889]
MTTNHNMAMPEPMTISGNASSAPELWQMLGSRDKSAKTTTPHVQISDADQMKSILNIESTDVIQMTRKHLQVEENTCNRNLDDDSQSSSAYHSTSASTPQSLSPNLSVVQTEEDGIPDIHLVFEAVERASFAQERIRFLHEYLTDPTTFNVTMSYAVEGPLQPTELAAAFRAMSNRHESLRTAFFLDTKDGDPQLFQGVLPETH